MLFLNCCWLAFCICFDVWFVVLLFWLVLDVGCLWLVGLLDFGVGCLIAGSDTFV